LEGTCLCSLHFFLCSSQSLISGMFLCYLSFPCNKFHPLSCLGALRVVRKGPYEIASFTSLDTSHSASGRSKRSACTSLHLVSLQCICWCLLLADGLCHIVSNLGRMPSAMVVMQYVWCSLHKRSIQSMYKACKQQPDAAQTSDI